MSSLVDSHCHLDCLDLDRHSQSLDEIIVQARELGVSHFLNVCIDLEHYPAVLEIAKAYEGIFASVGVHPNVWDGDDPSVEQLCELASDQQVVAIGETGLDYFRSDASQIAAQQARFRRHIRAAREVGKPLIIHMRDAAEDTLRIFREENAADCGGVMHCFTDTLQTAHAAIDLNFYISFSGIVTFKNAQALQTVAAALPLERLLVETDAPYLAPEPKRGRSNVPAWVCHTAQKIADLQGVTYHEVCTQTSHNFFQLFQEASR